MNWLRRWFMRRRPSVGLLEAKQALQSSRDRRPEVDEVVNDLKVRRGENAFAEALRLAFESERPRKGGDAA